MVLSRIERIMKSLLKINQFDAWSSVELNSFGSWKTSLFDLTHKFPRTALLVGNLVNSFIEKVLFCLLDHSFEPFPVFKSSRLFVCV